MYHHNLETICGINTDYPMSMPELLNKLERSGYNLPYKKLLIDGVTVIPKDYDIYANPIEKIPEFKAESINKNKIYQKYATALYDCYVAEGGIPGICIHSYISNNELNKHYYILLRHCCVSGFMFLVKDTIVRDGISKPLATIAFVYVIPSRRRMDNAKFIHEWMTQKFGEYNLGGPNAICLDAFTKAGWVKPTGVIHINTNDYDCL